MKMREILFRGKRKDNAEWVYGNFVRGCVNDFAYIVEFGNKELCRNYVEVIPSTIGQYSGLTDKNGTRIFEGDIVTLPAYQGGKKKSIVYFKNGKFAVDGSNYNFKDICPKRMEVIGNIHDNPELLKRDVDNG